MSSNTATAVTVTIPATIDAAITPNRIPRTRGGMHKRRRLQRELKDDTIRACQGAGLHLGHDLTPPIQLAWVVAWGKGRQRMDPSNLLASLKHAEDGIAQVIGIDDRHFVVPTLEQIRAEDGIGYVEVTITATGEDA